MAKAPEAKQSGKDSTSGRISICGGLFDVLPDSPLEPLNQEGGAAYTLQTSRGGGTTKFAVVVNPGVLPRHELMEAAASIKSPYVLQFVDSDVIYWPAFDCYRPVLVYEKPGGERFFERMGEERPPMKNEVAFKQTVESFVTALQEMVLPGCSHGRINLTNIYALDAAGSQVQLGDYLSCPAGVGQHPAFETPERLMALPVARGAASVADDIYAVGVCLLAILFGRLPVAAMDEQEILHNKLEKGSLMTLLNGMRLPGAYSELMRGMLSDDVNQRWTLDDISHWLSGRRLGSKPAAQVRRGQRGLMFNGVNYFNPRTLANEMSKNPAEAIKIIEDSSLERWVNRSLGDEERAATISEAVARAGAITRGGTPAERVVGRVVMALDPLAPLRFRDVFATPSGVGALLATRMMKGESPANVVELIAGQYMPYWSNLSENLNAENVGLSQQFDGMRMLLERTNYGFGVERVVYELNPSMPCISPLVAKYYPLTLAAVMRALEAEAGIEANRERDDKREPIDRHIAGFILSRYNRMNDRFFPLLTTKGDPMRRGLAILSIYAEMQRKFYHDDLPHLAAWLVKLLDPALQRFRNRSLRTRVGRDLLRLSRRGDLSAMAELIDNGNLQREDTEGFEAAKAQYIALEKAINDLGAGGERERKLLVQGQQITAFFACLLSFGLICLMVFWQII